MSIGKPDDTKPTMEHIVEGIECLLNDLRATSGITEERRQMLGYLLEMALAEAGGDVGYDRILPRDGQRH